MTASSSRSPRLSATPPAPIVDLAGLVGDVAVGVSLLPLSWMFRVRLALNRPSLTVSAKLSGVGVFSASIAASSGTNVYAPLMLAT